MDQMFVSDNDRINIENEKLEEGSDDDMVIINEPGLLSRFMNCGLRLIWPGVNVSRLRLIKDMAIDLFSTEVQPDMRTIFKDLCVEKTILHQGSKNHSHLNAAQMRCYANTSIEAFSNIIGRGVYSVSMSSMESKLEVDGTRSYHNSKDLTMLSKHDRLHKDHVIKMTDVDYYVNPCDYLYGNHMCLYTFSPKEVAGTTSDGDGSYWIDKNDYVTTVFSGGAIYKHRVWDYDGDHVLVDHGWYSWLYLLEKKDISKDRVIIYFNPVRKIYFPMNKLVDGDRYQYKKYCEGNGWVSNLFRMNDNNAGQQIYISIGREKCFESAIFRYDHYLSCLLREQRSKQPNMGNVERILNSYKLEDTTLKAALLHSYIAAIPRNHDKITTMGLSPPEFKHYQTLHPLVLEDGADNMRQIGPELAVGATVPSRSYNNDNACLTGRLENVRNPVKMYPPFVYQCLSEFVHHLLPDDVAHTLVPYDFDQQWEQFQRPSQRANVLPVVNSMFSNIVRIRSFQKAESYSKYTAPRNISTLPMEHNFPLGQFSLALSEHLKKQKWYAFGKHPELFISRLRDLCADYNKLQITDISKCDGSVGYIHYLLTQTVVLRAFPQKYASEISKLLYKESIAKGSTSNGVKYQQFCTTLSGSSNTSWRNTLINAFNDYVTHRKLKDKYQAWLSLGVYGGDDGISTIHDGKLLSDTCAQLGMKVKGVECKSGDSVDFLGRIYLDPWTTDESICDVKRHIVKLHLTASPKDIPYNLVLHRKAEGFRITDPVTPIISNWCHAVERCITKPSAKELEKFNSLTRNDLNYYARNYDSPFPILADATNAMTIISRDLNMQISDLEFMINTIDQCNTEAEFMNLPCFILHLEPSVDIDCQVGDNILKAPIGLTQTEQVQQIAETVAMPKIKSRNLERKIHTDISKKSSIPHKPLRGGVKIGSKVKLDKKPEKYMPGKTSRKTNDVIKLVTKCKYIVEGIKCPHKSCRFAH